MKSADCRERRWWSEGVGRWRRRRRTVDERAEEAARGGMFDGVW